MSKPIGKGFTYLKRIYFLRKAGDTVDKIIQVPISEEEKKIMDKLIRGRFKNESEFIQESIRHYLFVLIEENLDAVRVHSTATIDEINESVRESRKYIFQEFFSDESLFG